MFAVFQNSQIYLWHIWGLGTVSSI